MLSIRDFYIAPGAVITGEVEIGPGSNIWYGCVIRGDVARIVLGPRVNLQDGVIVHADTGAPNLIDEGVVVGHAAILHGVHVGRDTLIGIGARLLAGSDVGEECIIAAGAIVTEHRRIPARSVVMGIPGKVVREVTDAELARTRKINSGYVELAQRYARGAYPPPWQR